MIFLTHDPLLPISFVLIMPMFWAWLAPIIIAGIRGAFSWAGSRSQSNALTRSAQIQASASERAGQRESESFRQSLAFLREQEAYSREQFVAQSQRLEPYRALGGRSAHTLGHLMPGGAHPPGQGEQPQSYGDLSSLRTSSRPRTLGAGGSERFHPQTQIGGQPQIVGSSGPIVYLRDRGGRIIAVPRRTLGQQYA